MDICAATAGSAARAATAFVGPQKGVTATPAATRESQESRGVEDSVEISPTGSLASRLLCGADSLHGVKPRADGAVHLEDLESHLEEISAGLQTTLGNRFRAAGVDTSRSLDLDVDAAGAVRVTNDHPDKDKIEAMFADDQALADQFREVLALQQLVSAGQQHVAFAKAYAQDPEAAVAQYGVGSRGIEMDIGFRFLDGLLMAVDDRAA